MSNTIFSNEIKTLNKTTTNSVGGNALTGVIESIKFERMGHDSDTGRNYIVESTVNVPIDNIRDSDFIQYSSLDISTVNSWIVNNIDSDTLVDLNTNIQQQIDASKVEDARYAQMAEDAVPLPWDLTGPADSA